MYLWFSKTLTPGTGLQCKREGRSRKTIARALSEAVKDEGVPMDFWSPKKTIKAWNDE